MEGTRGSATSPSDRMQNLMSRDIFLRGLHHRVEKRTKSLINGAEQ